MKAKYVAVAGIVLMLVFVILLGTAAAQPALPCDPAYVSAAGNLIRVYPTGVDDTANIQCAFDAAVAAGPGMTLWLQPGTFHTAQILVIDFHGAFRGSGLKQTEIVNLPNLPVIPDTSTTPPSADNPWPSLFIFMDSDLDLSDMAIRIIGENPVTPWSLGGPEIFEEIGAVMIISGLKSHTQVSNILVEGQSKETSIFGYNVFNGIYFEGYITATDVGFEPLTGSFKVTNSTFRKIAFGSPIANLKDATVLISHNQYEDVFIGFDGAELQGSQIEVVNNHVQGFLGIDIWPFITGVDSDTSFLIANNILRSYYGILIEETFGVGTTCLLKGNNVQQVTDIGIFLGPGTYGCTVVGGNNKANVLDLGTDNILVGVNNMGTGVGPTISHWMRPR
jgi:hypothetical protein